MEGRGGETRIGRARRGFRRATALSCALAIGAGVATAGGGGGFDSSFSGDGRQTADAGGSEDISAVALTGGGKIVVAGSIDDDKFLVSRYRSDGSLDNSFAGDGHREIGFAGAATARDVDISNGRIVVSGNMDQGGSDFAVAVARLRSNGTLDPSFSGDGKRTYDFGGSNDGQSVEALGNGKMVIAVRALFGAVPDFFVMRLKENGKPDKGFGIAGDGVAQTNFGGVDRVNAMAVQNDGKIVLAGVSDVSGSQDVAVARFKPGGGIDPSFSGDGRKLVDLGADESATGVTLAPGNRIALAGISGVGSGDWLVARLRSHGKLDKSFSGDGAKITNPGGSDSLQGIGIDGNKIVVGGETNSSGSRRFAIGRYQNNGAVDTSFAGDGIKTFSIRNGAASEGARDVAVQNNGRIVAAGFTYDGSSGDQALVRVLP